jgi:hypothetical protein
MQLQRRAISQPWLGSKWTDNQLTRFADNSQGRTKEVLGEHGNGPVIEGLAQKYDSFLSLPREAIFAYPVTLRTGLQVACGDFFFVYQGEPGTSEARNRRL